MPHQRRESVEHLRASGERAVLSTEVLRDALGVAALIEGGFGEAERERQGVPPTVPSSNRRYQARIDAAAQEQTEWHIHSEAQQRTGGGGGSGGVYADTRGAG